MATPDHSPPPFLITNGGAANVPTVSCGPGGSDGRSAPAAGHAAQPIATITALVTQAAAMRTPTTRATRRSDHERGLGRGRVFAHTLIRPASLALAAATAHGLACP